MWAVRGAAAATAADSVGDAPPAPPPLLAPLQWVCLAVLEGHEKPVTALAAHALPAEVEEEGGGLLLASTSGGPDVIVWRCGGGGDANGISSGSSNCNGDATAGAAAAAADSLAAAAGAADAGITRAFGQAAWRVEQRIPVGTQTQLCADLAAIPGAPPGWLLLATGGADNAARLHVRAPGGPFRLQCRLTGHENWVRAVALAAAREEGEDGEDVLLLASASQDRYARVWRIGRGASTLGAAAGAVGGGGGSSSAGGDGASGGGLAALITRYAPRPHIEAAGATHWCALEALLVGHEDWVHSAAWRPLAAAAAAAGGGNGSGDAGGNGSGGSGERRPPRRGDLALLTASQDRSMLLWRCDAASGLWLSEASVGDAGASCLGYFGGAFSPDGRRIVAHGFTGALHMWSEQQQEQEDEENCGAGGGAGRRAGAAKWLPRHACGGHFAPVADVCWGADGRCVQSAAADQTARLFTDARGRWCEFARTQVHGHDFSCIASVPVPGGGGGGDSGAVGGGGAGGSGGGGRSFMYVSGSEEKVLRAFEAPATFLDSLDLARGRPRGATAAALGVSAARGALALGAAVGALALSNKAVFAAAPTGEDGGDGDGGGDGGDAAAECPEGPDMLPRAAPAVVAGAPLEEHLAQNTLWPEVRKLYGHGSDVHAAAASPCGRLLASACRATAAPQAAVWVWEVGSWRARARLEAHALTVTQLAFSPRGSMLLSGSRDRSFAVWRVPPEQRQQQPNEGGSSSGGGAAAGGENANGGGSGSSSGSGGGFELLSRVKAAHARVIWGVAWSHDERCAATCSRDATVKLWAVAPPAAAAAAAAVGGGAGAGAAPGAGAAVRHAATLPPFKCAATAVALAPAHVCAALGGGGEAVYACAVGLEDGSLQVWAVPCALFGDGGDGSGAAAAPAPRLLWASAPGEGHAAAVRRIAWAPASDAAAAESAGEGPLVATCGDDHAVRVYEVQLV